MRPGEREDDWTPDYSGDLELARRAAGEEPDALKAIVVMMGKTVKRQAQAATRAYLCDAEDLEQEALLACVQKEVLNHYRGTGPLAGYLQSVSLMKIIGIVRTSRWKHRWDRPHAPDRDVTPDVPAEYAVLTDGRERLRKDFTRDFAKCFGRLSKGQQFVVLAMVQGTPDQDVAVDLGCKVGTVRTIRHRALIQLRLCLGEWGDFYE